MSKSKEIIDFLKEKKLAKDVEGNIELSHDILASLIAKKQKSLLEIKGIIRYAQISHQQNKKTYLNPKQIDQIDPHLHRLLLKPEEKEFIQESKKHNQNRRIQLISLVVFITLTLLGITIWALAEKNNARESQYKFIQQQLTNRLNEGKQYQKADNYTEAVNSYQAGLLILKESPYFDNRLQEVLEDSIRSCKHNLALKPTMDSLLKSIEQEIATAQYINLFQAQKSLAKAKAMNIYKKEVKEKEEVLQTRIQVLMAEYMRKINRFCAAGKSKYAKEILDKATLLAPNNNQVKQKQLQLCP